MQSFVALHCVFRKSWGFLNQGELIPTTRTTKVAPSWSQKCGQQLLRKKAVAAKDRDGGIQWSVIHLDRQGTSQ